MKDIITIQVSIMLQDSLPNATDYERIAKKIYEESGISPATVTLPVPNKEIWKQLPPEVPRIVGQSDTLDFQISAANLFLTLKNDQMDAFGNVVQIVSDFFEDTGKGFKIGYRLGIVLTARTDPATLGKNARNVLTDEILQKREWQFSYLDDAVEESVELNVWKKYICNRTDGTNLHIIDVNVKPTANLDLRNDSVRKIFEIVKNQVDKTYDEFK